MWFGAATTATPPRGPIPLPGGVQHAVLIRRALLAGADRQGVIGDRNPPRQQQISIRLGAVADDKSDDYTPHGRKGTPSPSIPAGFTRQVGDQAMVLRGLHNALQSSSSGQAVTGRLRHNDTMTRRQGGAARLRQAHAGSLSICTIRPVARRELPSAKARTALSTSQGSVSRP